MLRTCLVIAVSLLKAASLFGSDGSIDYEREVKPVLKARCYSCHGALKQESKLRLDTGASIHRGGENGPAVTVGKVESSLVVERIVAADESVRMPPEGEALSAEQIQLIKSWIEQGARSPANEQSEEDPREHWAFKKPKRLIPPAVNNAEWVQNPIDAFIAAKHERHGLVPLLPAKKQILLRRVYLDLIGLPPTREELHVFLANDSPDAYAKVVNRLLDSKHYGERWGRHWMDVWRYSDWYGRRQVGDVRNSYPHIWRWRDWIIRSLNEDKGYDQMVREMLAADELHPTDDTRMPALGFIVRNWFSLNYDTWKQDLVEHTGKAFLGLRINCAHCHDHKYDPISQEEYFKFRAFFEPLELRHDRVPGGPALAKYIRYKAGGGASLKPIKDGLPRVYDLTHDEKTFMYRLGDTRDRFDRPPVSPGAPALLGGDKLTIEPIELPPAAWYPALKSFVHDDEIGQRQEAIKSSEAALATAKSTIQTFEQQLAEAKQDLASVEAKAGETPDAAPRSMADLIAWWRFEGPDDDSGFLTDSSDNGHTLRRITGSEPPAALFALANDGTTKAFLKSLPAEGTENKQAAEFKQVRSFAYLATTGGSDLYANTFTLEALVHFDVSKRNFNRTIADYEGSWTLLHRGLDDKTFELRLRYFNKQGQLRDVATGSSAGAKFVLQTAHDYYLCLVMGEQSVTLWAADLTSRTPLQSFQFSRSTSSEDFAALAQPADNVSFKIGNSDGTGRVVGLIDEVRYTRGGLSVQQIAAAIGQSADAAVQQAAMRATDLKSRLTLSQLARASAETRLASTQAGLRATQARIAADRARHGAAENADDSARAAFAAEQRAKLAGQRAKLAEAERLLVEYRVADKPDAKKVKQSEQDAAAARKAIAALEKDAGKTATNYTPLGPEYPKTSTGRRRALAEWMTNRDNPLTARVAVNHIWMRHFGRPLVESVFDFGRAGKKPTHPELLDWLAVELMESGWSMKHLHRLIVTSQTYQQSSRSGGSDHPNFAIDKDNRFWWRFDRRRLEAEIIRDSMLHLSGQLDSTLGGPEIDPSAEVTSRRRSLYFAIYPEAGGTMRFLTLFDAPDPGDCYRRTDSILPQQALAMSNSVLSLNQGRLLADKLSKELATSDTTGDDFVIALFEHALCRTPTSTEQQTCLEFLTTQRALYATASAAELKATATKDTVAAAASPEQRARESLVRTLLNHNDFISLH